MKHALALACLLFPLPALAQTIPDTPMGRLLSEDLAVINSGDTARIEAFATAHHFAVSTEEQLLFFHQTGGVILTKVESSDDTSITALVQQKDGGSILRMTLRQTGTADAPRLDAQIRDVPPPAEPATRLSEDQAIAALDARASALAAQDRLSGAMLIARNGKILYSHAWGLADRAAGTPNTLDTKFRLGSNSKMFTAVAALQLVAAGKLSLDGTVGEYLPDYPNRDVATKVTVRMLLSHRGGTGDFFGPEFDKNRLTLKHNEDYIALFGNRPPAFEPGTRNAYSNFGYIILGSIIQHVSGEDYYAYVRNHVFRPAGMTGTDSLPESDAVPGRSTGYMRWDSGWKANTDTLPVRATAAGGGTSTVRDLLKFVIALENGKLLPPALKQQAIQAQGGNKGYGFGFAVQGTEGPEHWYGHGGGAPGMNADLRVFPQSGTVIVTLANLDPPVANQLAEFYIARMPLN